MNRLKLLVRGGSIPAGKGVKRSYVDMINEHFQEFLNVINRSREQETSFDGIWSFHEDISPFKPDILMIHFGMDDAYAPVYRSEFKENLVQTVRLARPFIPRILLLTSHQIENPFDMDVMNIYYRAIREVSVDLDCEMIPVHTFWAGFIMDEDLKTSLFVQEDVRLPNEKGHEIYARALLPAIHRALRRTQ